MLSERFLLEEKIMNQAAETLYKQIGDYIDGAIDDEWALAWAYMEAGAEESGTTFGRYTTVAGPTEEVKPFDTDHRLCSLFAELRTSLQQPDKEPWQSAIFTMSGGG